MFPDLIDLGFLHLKTYGACMAVGFLLCWKLVELLYVKAADGDKSSTSSLANLSNLIFFMMISGVVGARLAYVIEHWSQEFAAHPAAILRVDQGGLMFYGGFLLATLVFLGYCRWKQMPTWRLVNLFAIVLPLGHACGRIGCFFYGCCYGRISNSPFAVCFPRSSPAWYEQLHQGLITASAQCSVPVMPTQLLEAGLLLGLFLLLFFVIRKRTWLSPVSVYLVGYGLIRFLDEYLRGDPRVAFCGLSIGQCISVGLIGCGLLLMSLGRRGLK